MVLKIATTLFLGFPLVMYGGILTFLMLLLTATVGLLNYRGIHIIPFKWHPWLALLTIIISVIHGIMGLSLILNF